MQFKNSTFSLAKSYLPLASTQTKPINPTFRYLGNNEFKSGSQRAPTFTAALVTIVKMWTHLNGHQLMNGSGTVVYTYSEMLLGLIKEGNPAICNLMDEPGKHYVK